MTTYISLIVYQLIFEILINKKSRFNISPIAMFTSCFLSMLYQYTFDNIAVSFVIMGLINISFMDIKYYEVDSKVYYFVLAPVLLFLATDNIIILEHIVSFVIMLAMFKLMDMFIGIEHIGGADTKIILILSLMISYFEVLMFLIFVFVFSLVFLVIKKVIYLLIKKKEKVQIPMLVVITFVSFLFFTFV